MKRQKTIAITVLLFLLAIILILILEPINQLFSDYLKIILNPSILLTDYLAIAGLAATLLNVLLTVLLNIIIVLRLKQNFTGPVVASLFIIAGFAFFGKNILNSLPIYCGVYLYAFVTKRNLKDLILILLLSSGISPLVSYLAFGLDYAFYISIPLALFFGILVGFVLPVLNQHAFKFHQGYNLYASGFSMGILSMVLSGLFQSFHIPVNTVFIITHSYHTVLLYFVLCLSLVFIFYGVLSSLKNLQRYLIILKSHGRLYTDFFQTSGINITILNMGILGLISFVIIISTGFMISGPVFGAILTLIGFGAFGKNPLNTLPLFTGALIAIYVTPVDINESTIMALFFVTGLAPIAGDFGIFAGILAGFLHLMIAPPTLTFQGGFDLYNNGFAAGFIAAIIVPIFQALKNRKSGFMVLQPSLNTANQTNDDVTSNSKVH